MSSGAADSSDDKDLQRIIHLINASHKDPDDSGAQEEALQSSLKYLSSLPAGAHLLADNGCGLLVREALQLFAFPSSSALEWLKSTLDNHLKNCFICVKQFHRQRTLLHKSMLDTYDRDTVTEFFNILIEWDSSRLLSVLDKAGEYCATTEKPQPSSIPQSFNAMYECLCCPQLLDQPQIRSAFRKVFFGLQTRGRFLHLSTEIVPGIFMFLFSDHQDEREWAYRTFRQHKSQITDFDVMLVDAYNHVMLQTYQRQTDQQYMLVFWKGIEILLSKTTKHVIVKNLRGEQTDIIRFLSMHLQSYPTASLPILLGCFSILLKRLDSDFWDCVSPYIPQNFTDTIFGNPYFKSLVSQQQQQEQEQDNNNETDNLFEWITPFLASLSGPALQKSCCAILKPLLSTFQSASIPPSISSSCAKRGFQLIVDLLSQHNQQHQLLLDDDAVNRIARRERRELPQPYLNLIFRYAFQPPQQQQQQDITTIRDLARDIIQLCIQLDCLLIIQDNLAALNKNKQLSSPPVFYSSFWDLLQKQIPAQDVDCAKRIIPSLSNAALGEQLPIKPDMKDKQQRKELNAVLFEFFHSVAAILLKFGNTAPQDKLNEMVKDGDVVESIFMCLFSSNASIYQASVDLIKQAFDTEGRMESLQALFTQDFNGSLQHFTTAINRCSAPGRFGPGPRMIRACMDLNEVLFDSRDGLLLLSAAPNRNSNFDKPLILRFWSDIWSMLGTLYKQTMMWADQYPKDLMIDFMRDVLDFSNSLTANYTQLEQLFTETQPLLQSIINPLSSMSQWLRLSDSALLDSCVQLICQILHLLYTSPAKHSLPNDTLEVLYKLAYKTKKHHNNLSESQCDKLIIALSKFDYYRFDAPESAAAANKQAKLDKWLAANNNTSTSASSTDDVIEIIDDEATLKSIIAAKNKANQQAKITSFTKKLSPGTKPSFPPPPPPPKKPLPSSSSSAGTGAKPSLISSMRAELAEKRRIIPPPPQRTASPAGTAGLRSTIQDNKQQRKTGQQQQQQNNRSDSSSLSSDNDDDDDDDDSDMDGLFSVSKHNRIRSSSSRQHHQPIQISKPTPIGVTSRRIREKQPPQQLSGRELAEQRMRSRLNIDMNPFYKQILKWNYHNDKPFPSDMSQDQYKVVENTFSSVPNYQQTFEPLLMLECWQAILQSKTEQGNKPFKLAIGSRAAVDDFIDIYAFASNQLIQDIKIADTDLVVLSYIADSKSSSSSMLPSPNHICCLAKISQVKRSNPEFTDFTLRTFNPVGMLPHLAPKVELHCLKVINLTTIEREYQALKALPFYELCDAILKAKPAPSIRSDDSVVKRLQANYGVNEPQARAIASALSNDGFTLIQGPPGTGKTKTILGIAAAFLGSNKTRGAPITIPGRSNNINNATTNAKAAIQQQKRILVCAPSNAAVDELVLRLKSGINSVSGSATFAPKVVRLGRSEIINPQVRDLTLEELVDKYLTEYEEKQKDKLDSQSDIRKQHQQVVLERDQIRNKLQGPEAKKLSSQEIAKLETKLYELIRLRSDLGRQLDEQRDRAKTMLRNRDIERKNVQSKILNEAQVICSTLSGSAHEVLANLSLTFETIIIDEAAQCIELSALIPLKFGCTRCIMVGDPNQLPPTVLSQAAASFKYEQSLFVRMQTNYPNSVHLLSIQYRMHPDISYFPSKQFYDGKLIDGPGMAQLTARQWHEKKEYGPYILFDIRGIEEVSPRTKSIFNKIEAEQVLELYNGLIQAYPIIDFDGKIGIVTPYKQQLLYIKSVFRRRYGDLIFQSVDFNTVDGFQGQEKEIVIFSTVRSQSNSPESSSTIGFLSDVRRMNVGLTRAKCSMWIVGDCKVLQSNNIWNNLVKDAHHRKRVLSAKPEFLARAHPPNRPQQKPDNYSGSRNGTKRKYPSKPYNNNNNNSSKTLPDQIPGDTLKTPAELSHSRPRAPIPHPTTAAVNKKQATSGRYFDFDLDGDVEKVIPPKSKPPPKSEPPLPPPPPPPSAQSAQSTKHPVSVSNSQRLPPPPPRKRSKGDDVFIRPRRPMPHHSMPPRR